ncbi:MAG: C cytochrome precursor [Pirellulaceae bacterium]|nr:C cytochrome precursor [Pirellulaceae bacterium]
MNYLVLFLAAALSLVLSGLLYWRYKTIAGAIGSFVLIVGGIALVLPWDLEQPITDDSGVVTGADDSGRLQPQADSSPEAMTIRQAAITQKELEEFRPIEVHSHGFVGSDACKECHANNHASWDASYHSKMTQVAEPENVLGNFDNIRITHKDKQYFLGKTDEACVVNMPDLTPGAAPGQRLTAPIVMTTGSHHMQVYWFATGKGRMTGMLPLVHLNETNEWIPRESAFLVSHPEVSFETGRWNAACSNCHSTHRKTRQANTGKWDTHVGEFGISCEACHGPGEDHIGYHRDLSGPSIDSSADSDAEPQIPRKFESDPIANPENLSKVRSAQVCGQCHSLMDHLVYDEDFQINGHKYRPGKDLLETHMILDRNSPEYKTAAEAYGFEDLETMLNQTFYPDGMVRVSGREYNGLTQSACYINGEMTCLSCHKMHKDDSDSRTLKEWANDQLQPDALGNKGCTQCHDADDYSTAHTHHEVGSTGSSCYNCHMPHTAYGLLKAIRNHTISSPDVGKDVAAQRPNACNLCHLDRTLEWSADHLNEWYDIEKPELDKDEKSVAGSLLWLLRGNAAERALAAYAMGWETAQAVSGEDWQLPFLAALLDDEYDAIRLIARRSLKSLPGLKSLKFDVVRSTTIDDRQEVATILFERWLAATAGTRKDRPEILIDKENGYDAQRVDDLLEQRDNTPIILIE